MVSQFSNSTLKPDGNSKSDRLSGLIFWFKWFCFRPSVIASQLVFNGWELAFASWFWLAFHFIISSSSWTWVYLGVKNIKIAYWTFFFPAWLMRLIIESKLINWQVLLYFNPHIWIIYIHAISICCYYYYVVGIIFARNTKSFWI